MCWFWKHKWKLMKRYSVEKNIESSVTTETTKVQGRCYELHCQKCGDIKLKTIYAR